MEQPITTEHAFLLLKPDCLRQGLTGAAERAIAATGLSIIHRRTLTLTPADVRALWTEYTESGHVLARAFLDRYLTSAPSQAVLVTGDDAFEQARRVKRRLRGRYALGVFANVVHAAETRDELARQMDHLFGGTAGSGTARQMNHLLRGTAGSEAARHMDHHFGDAAGSGTARHMDHHLGGTAGSEAARRQRPRPHGIDFRAVFDVPKLVDDLWPLLQQDLAAPPPHRLGNDDTAALILGGDRDHTLDSTVSAIWRALPGVDPGHAVLLALHADRTGGSPIAVGGRRPVARAARALRHAGIRHCWSVEAPEQINILPGYGPSPAR